MYWNGIVWSGSNRNGKRISIYQCQFVDNYMHSGKRLYKLKGSDAAFLSIKRPSVSAPHQSRSDVSQPSVCHISDAQIPGEKRGHWDRPFNPHQSGATRSPGCDHQLSISAKPERQFSKTSPVSPSAAAGLAENPAQFPRGAAASVFHRRQISLPFNTGLGRAAPNAGRNGQWPGGSRLRLQPPLRRPQ